MHRFKRATESLKNCLGPSTSSFTVSLVDDMVGEDDCVCVWMFLLNLLFSLEGKTENALSRRGPMSEDPAIMNNPT